jgi:hypothetical protein
MTALSAMCAITTPSLSRETSHTNWDAGIVILTFIKVKKSEHLSKMSQLSLLMLERPVLSPAAYRASTCPSGMYRMPGKPVQRSG